ncbi:disease resistance protein RPV1-like [Hevea brasiliensis]|uniref:disease resistance protein RPV1-like n=1 Tax=Hevea brasiliensis TaxID=3981 RepID=UPI0025D46AE3|nr:disease resistance protein RPV1-like [Hevea brasiliensis]
MASTSSSTPPYKYDVFISFRGEIRYGFLSHLSAALHQKQINAFTDENLRKGEEISPALLKIIQESCVSIVIFSENYADSPWCLDELVKILECKETLGQTVLPVFYHVDPTDVQELTGNFGKAFAIAMHGEQVKGRLHKMDAWKHALMEVSNLSGWDSGNITYESKLVEEIVNDVLKKFIVGIWGMGGIGKTTIAQEVFRRNVTKFDAYCFVDNVKEIMTQQPSIVVRDKIIYQLLREKNIHENTLDLNAFIGRRLQSKKVFIVFDDIDDPNHLKKLAGECDLYNEGSRLIVTSRDWQVLKNVCSREGIYEVEKLVDYEDLKLFSLHAFKQNHPKEGYMELSLKAISYAGGNPLALTVLGSHLFDMGIEEWKSELKKLKGGSLMKIQDILKTSYDGLERNEKKIFLDIACFFKWENIYSVDMHDLLEKMGKDIVIEECKQPGRRSRLWNYEDVRHVLTTDMGTENVEGILLDMYKKDNLEISSTAFMRMCNLRFLKIQCYIGGQVLLPNNLKFLPQELRYLYWNYYPLTSLPLNFCPKNLVQLHMRSSKLIQLWNGDKSLGNLKLIDLSYSEHLIRIPDLSTSAPNLEFLFLMGCKSLVEIPSSLQNLSKLTQLKLDETGIQQLPSSIEHLSQLFNLSLIWCTRLVNLPSTIGKLKRLEELFLCGCSNLPSLPESIKQLTKLRRLNLTGCKRLKCLPELPSCLEYLNASDCICLESASTSFLFLKHEHEDDNDESADRSEDEDFFEDDKFLVFGDCINLKDENKVMEDVFEAHLLGQKVSLYMAGSEVPERMRYKNKSGSCLSFRLDLRHLIAFSFCAVIPTAVIDPTNYYFDLRKGITCRVDFIGESGQRHSHDFFLFGYRLSYFKYSSEHVVLWFSDNKFHSIDEECFVEASFHSTENVVEIIECGVHPIYSGNKKRSRNDEEQQPSLQRLEECHDFLNLSCHPHNNTKRRIINYEEEEKEEEASSLDLSLSLSLPGSS